MARKDPELLLHFYEDMLRIRFFEEKIRDVMLPQHLFRGSSHLSIGQEAAAVGAVHALDEDDYVISTHRGHGHALAKGMDPYTMFAEIMGRATGCCRGKGGSMHLAQADIRFMGENPVVGSNSPIATGIALAAKLEGGNRVVADFFGEGALNNGSFHEAANVAALWRLPVLLLCENNMYAISVPLDKSSAVMELENRACAYGIEGKHVNGMRVMDVYEAVKSAVQRLRQDPFPEYFVLDTYRFEGHHTADKQTYRTDKETLAEFRERDPIHLLEREMIEDHTVAVDTPIEYRERIRTQIDEAFDRALRDPWPAPEDALVGLYTE